MTKKELFSKYFLTGFNHYALSGDREKLWLCMKENLLFEKKSIKIVSEECPNCGGVSYQPSEIGFRLAEVCQKRRGKSYQQIGTCISSRI